MDKKIIILLEILFLIPFTVQAIQPEERTTKLYLNPFYVNSMTQNIDYNYTVLINPPDGISSVKSAILVWDMWINPARNFTVKVNEQLCNTQFYYISTTYAGAGRAVATFDCSNVITRAGLYNITYRVSGGNIGSSTAWLELTYMNNPIGEIYKIGGTEYDILDKYGTIFLQLLNNQKQPISNATCFSTIFYPNTSIMENQSLMTYLQEGIHFKHIIIPNITGVYILSAFCLIPNTINITIWDNFDCATSGSCGNGWSGNWVQTAGDCKFQDGADSPHSLPYHLKSGGAGCQAYRKANMSLGNNACYVNFWAKAKDLGVTENCKYIYFNGTNSFTLLTIIDGEDDDIYKYYSFEVCNTYGKSNNSGINVSFNNDKCYLDDVNITIINDINTTEYQILRGSGELHITDRFSNIIENLTKINDSVFKLNESQFNYFQQILAYLQSINYTLNTTLEYKLDLINGTVMQVNQTTFDILQHLVDINNSITQYLIVINDTTYQINQSQYQDYISLLQAINSVNDTQNWQYIKLLELLLDINATGNTTLDIVASINQTLWNNIIEILKDINYTTNTTLEYKLDLINYTTWHSWIMLQNLTIGNVTVSASINWTEGLDYIWNATTPQKIKHDLLSLSQEGIQMVGESYICLDNMTLQTTMNITNCMFGICENYNRTITTICAWGCQNNQCLPQPSIQFGIAILIVLIISLIIYLIWRFR